MSNQRDVGGDTLPDDMSDFGARIEAFRAKLRQARTHALSPEEQASIEALIAAIDALLGEEGA